MSGALTLTSPTRRPSQSQVHLRRERAHSRTADSILKRAAKPGDLGDDNPRIESSSEIFACALAADEVCGVLESLGDTRHRPVRLSPFGMRTLDQAAGPWRHDQTVAAGRCLNLTDFFQEVLR